MPGHFPQKRPAGVKTLQNEHNEKPTGAQSPGEIAKAFLERLDPIGTHHLCAFNLQTGIDHAKTFAPEALGEVVAGQMAVRFGARGSLVLADGNLFAVQDSSNAFVLADSRGVPGIHVLREQRPAGVTGRTGKRLIADITPNVPLRIGIDPAALPVGVDAA